MNDRERKDNELGIDLDMKGLTLDSDEAAKPQAQNRPMSHEDMARMIAKNMAMQDGGFDEPITPVRGVSDFGEETIKPKKPKTTETRSKNAKPASKQTSKKGKKKKQFFRELRQRKKEEKEVLVRKDCRNSNMLSCWSYDSRRRRLLSVGHEFV